MKAKLIPVVCQALDFQDQVFSFYLTPGSKSPSGGAIALKFTWFLNYMLHVFYLLIYFFNYMFSFRAKTRECVQLKMWQKGDFRGNSGWTHYTGFVGRQKVVYLGFRLL